MPFHSIKLGHPSFLPSFLPAQTSLRCNGCIHDSLSSTDQRCYCHDFSHYSIHIYICSSGKHLLWHLSHLLEKGSTGKWALQFGHYSSKPIIDQAFNECLMAASFAFIQYMIWKWLPIGDVWTCLELHDMINKWALYWRALNLIYLHRKKNKKIGEDVASKCFLESHLWYLSVWVIFITPNTKYTPHIDCASMEQCYILTPRMYLYILLT